MAETRQTYQGHTFKSRAKEKTYEIVRFRFKDEPQVIASGKTLEEAQEWCSREDTHGEGWFDGYREE